MKPYNEIVHTMKVNGAQNNTGHFPFLRTWSGHIEVTFKSQWVHGEKGPAEDILSSPAEEVQPAIQFYSAII